MVRTTGEEVDIITNLVNQIIVKEAIVNWYKGKGDSLERGKYRGLKLTDQILQIAERIIEKLIR